MTHTTTAQEHVEALRAQVQAARAQLRELCDRDTAIMVAYRLKAVQYHEARLAVVEAALEAGDLAAVLSDNQIPF
jgi:hypothetical protein